jgi:hypothetical protein
VALELASRELGLNMTPRPSRLMTPRPSRLYLGHGHPTLDPNAARAAPLCQLWTCQTRAPKSHAHGVRHGVGRDCRGCLRAYAYTTSTVPVTWGRPVTTPPARASTSRSAPSQAPQERAPNATSQRRWGGSTPNHPAALRSGMRMGFETPEQHHGTHSQASGRGRKFHSVVCEGATWHKL